MPRTVQRVQLVWFIVAAFVASTVAAQPVPQPEAQAPVLVYTTGLEPVEKPAAGSLQVSTGGAIADGSAALKTDPAALTKVLGELGYQAVNIAAVDLEENAAAVRALGATSAVPLISANLYTADKQQRMFKPYTVVQALGRRVGVTGVTSVRGESKDFAVVDPAKSLKDVLASLASESDLIVLLAAMDRVSAAALVEAHPSIKLCVVNGRGIVDPLPLKVAAAHVLQAPPASSGFARAKVAFDDKHVVQTVTVNAVPRLTDLPTALTSFRQANPRFPEPIAVGAKPAETGGLVDGIAVDQTVFPRVRANNRAAHLRVDSVRLATAYGAVKPSDGTQLLVLGTRWENLIPLTVIYQKKVPTEYQIPNLADHCYLVVNGRHVARLHPKADELPGHLAVKNFKLPEIGARENGNLLFELPASEPIKTIELRFYDYAHGHLSARVVGTDEAFAASEKLKPVQPPLKNEVVEAGVFGLSKLPEFNGQKAPAGMNFVIADLRARSMFTFEGDATAFDPKAKAGAKMQIGTVADWTEAHKYLQLVVDGERAYMPIVPGTTLAEAPRFLPDVFTGGDVVFLAPADAKSLELRCDFPNAKPPGGGANFRPAGVLLALEGKRPALANPKPIASVQDDVYRLAITGQATPDTFAGTLPPHGKRFLVLDVTVNNAGAQGELFQTKEQLKAAMSDGAQVEIDPLTYQGKYRPTELVFIPPRERRSFQVAYAIPAGETTPRLAYGGISLAKNLNLQPIAAASAVAAANPAPAPAPTPALDAPAKPEPAKPQVAEPAKTQVAVNVPPKTEPQTEPPAVAPGKPVKQAAVKVLRVPAKQPHEPKGLAGVGLKPEQVNNAIDRGAAFMWNDINKEIAKGYEFGYRQEHMLASLALVHADAHKTFPEFDAAVRKYIANFDPTGGAGTYMVGLYCMLIDAYGDPTYLPQMRKAAQWLLDTQGPNGTWGYGIPLKDAEAGIVVRRVLQVAGGRPLDEPRGGQPLTRKTEWEKGSDGDNSVTQYALLGLHAAGRFDVKVPKETWQRTLAEHRKRQDPAEGGFAYNGGGVDWNYGSMTCAGICALALARYETGEKDFAADADIERGLAWMSNYFTIEGNPHPSRKDPKALSGEWHYYYLYSLERVGRILDTEFIGPYEWYPLGAKLLLARQRSEDGAWLSKEDNDNPILSTSFALLFLTRATESLELPKREGPGTLKTVVVTPPGQKIYIILDGSGTMMEENNGVPRFEVARSAMARLTGELSKSSQVGLRVFGHRKSSIDPGADEDTELVAPMNQQGRETAIAALLSLRPRGKTPLARTLIAAAADVKGKGTEEDPVTVLLVTDGGEDNTKPPMPPLEAAKELGEIPGVRWFVVGFDVGRPEWVKQLDGLARSGGGQYLSASDGDALHREMRTAILGTPESFAVHDDGGRPVKSGPFGQSLTLPEGKYKFQTTFGGQTFAQDFWINAGTTTAITFDAANIAHDKEAAQAPSPARAPAPAVAPAGAPAPANQFCTSCGTKLAGGAKFCTACGAKQ